MIYLDNAATTLYKSPEVGQAMLDALQTAGNPGRGAHAPTLHASRIVYETREALARLFHAGGPACIAFASNATQALNTAINGLFGPGDHVITTVCEHNSVLRPLYRLQRQGVEVSFVDVDANGVLCYAQFEQLLRPNTRGVVVTGASNVTGNRTDLVIVSAFAKKHGLLFLVDAAQTAGAMPMDVPGIAGLGAGVRWLLTQDVEALETKENALARLFYETVREIPGVRLYGDFTAPRAPIVSLNLVGEDSARVADALWEEYGICVRAGAHCAPLMHRALGTVEQGVVRFSFSHTNTREEARAAARAVRSLAEE